MTMPLWSILFGTNAGMNRRCKIYNSGGSASFVKIPSLSTEILGEASAYPKALPLRHSPLTISALSPVRRRINGD